MIIRFDYRWIDCSLFKFKRAFTTSFARLLSHYIFILLKRILFIVQILVRVSCCSTLIQLMGQLRVASFTTSSRYTSHWFILEAIIGIVLFLFIIFTFALLSCFKECLRMLWGKWSGHGGKLARGRLPIFVSEAKTCIKRGSRQEHSLRHSSERAACQRDEFVSIG